MPPQRQQRRHRPRPCRAPQARIAAATFAVALLLAACHAPATGPQTATDTAQAADVADSTGTDADGGAHHDGDTSDGAPHDDSSGAGDGPHADQAVYAALQPQPTFEASAQLALAADGRSDLWTVTLPLARRYLALRAEAVPAAPDDPACLRLVDVKRSDGEVWVGPGLPGAATASLGDGTCDDCPRPVSTQHGYALAVFADPSQGLASAGSVQLRVQLRHCATDLALPLGALGSQITHVRLQAASEPAVAATAPGTLAVVVARGPGVGAAAAPAAIAAMTEAVAAAFAPAHVALSALPTIDLVSTGLPATLDVSSPAAPHLLALQAAVDAAWQLQPGVPGPLAAQRVVAVVLWPCLHHQGPLGSGHALAGFSSRVPGGGRVGPFASLVIAATGDCGRGQPPTGGQLGGTVAHELGHLLGLYHSDGAHGLPEPGGFPDLMHSDASVSGAAGAGFGATARGVLRAHPDVAFHVAP